MSAASWAPQPPRELKAKWERARRLTVASPSRCKLDTKGNWKLPVKLSSPSPRLVWESSPAESAEHPALGSCPHLVDYKLPAARRIKGGGACQVHQGRNVSDSTSEDRPHIGEHVCACSLAQSVLSDSVYRALSMVLCCSALSMEGTAGYCACSLALSQ